MRGFLKVILPPIVNFGLFFTIVKIYMPAHSMQLDDISDGNIYSLMAYYHLFTPLLLLVALLTQYLIVVPLWNRLEHRPPSATWITFGVIAIICLVFAGGVSYLIWDQPQGTAPFIKFWWYFTLIQTGYWAINFLIMYLVDRRAAAAPSDPPV